MDTTVTASAGTNEDATNNNMEETRTATSDPHDEKEECNDDNDEDVSSVDDVPVVDIITPNPPTADKLFSFGCRFQAKLKIKGGKNDNYWCYPFLNELNTADLILCEALLLHYVPWKFGYGKVKVQQDLVMQHCRTTPDVHGQFPLQYMNLWVPVSKRFKQYNVLRTYVESNTVPFTGDCAVDKLLEEDDGISATNRNVVRLWRAVKRVLASQKEHNAVPKRKIYRPRGYATANNQNYSNNNRADASQVAPPASSSSSVTQSLASAEYHHHSHHYNGGASHDDCGRSRLRATTCSSPTSTSSVPSIIAENDLVCTTAVASVAKVNHDHEPSIHEPQESRSNHERVAAAENDELCAAAIADHHHENENAALDEGSASVEKKFSWSDRVHIIVKRKNGGSYLFFPFLNDSNTADLIMCQALLLHYLPRKLIFGEEQANKDRVLQYCRTTSDTYGKFPLKYIKDWSTVVHRFYEFTCLKEYVENNTIPLSGDSTIDKLLEVDDGTSETNRVVVQLWRALKRIFVTPRVRNAEPRNHHPQEEENAASRSISAAGENQHSASATPSSASSSIHKNQSDAVSYGGGGHSVADNTTCSPTLSAAACVPSVIVTSSKSVASTNSSSISNRRKRAIAEDDLYAAAAADNDDDSHSNLSEKSSSIKEQIANIEDAMLENKASYKRLKAERKRMELESLSAKYQLQKTRRELQLQQFKIRMQRNRL